MLDQVQDAGLDVVSLDEAVTRLEEGTDRRFVSFTFDDGYRDILEHAYPLFKAHGLPMTIYVPTDFPDGKGELWWLALEKIVARAEDGIELCRNGDLWQLPTGTVAEKQRSFEQIYWWLRSLDESTQRQIVSVLADRYGIDMAKDCRDLIMTWERSGRAADPLVTIGARTRGHYAVSKLTPLERHRRAGRRAGRIERELGVRPEHFSFPYGDPGSAGRREFALARELGFKTAVTTRKGMLFPAHAAHLTALPRVSLNGDYRSLTYTALYLSGAPFALWSGFQQVSAA
ncbi:MAG: polysaccharide deacetylase family protein [Methyloceanibacter sp.]|uniref:polysaccharide deacetylase family protein n=1 Tax=Methyloceanibacter sp. TaxID=1965321 RepID=UPI003D9BB793